MFSCKFCGRTFTAKHACTQHEKYHCNINPDRQKINRDIFYTEHKKTACPICGKLFDVANIKKHETSCGKPKKESTYRVTHEGLNCIFCGKLCKHKNSLAQHELRCKENPERKSFNCLADYIIVETDEAKQLRYGNCHNTLRARIATGEVCYDNTVRSKYKFGTYAGYHCDSSWELAFVLYNLDHGVAFTRNTSCFPYEYDGVIHNYYPDFIIDNVYYEIKSYVDDRVRSKCRGFPSDKTLIILDQDKMQKYLSYCENKYGKNFAELYDRSSPSWMDLI
jgi:hypothetical protein